MAIPRSHQAAERALRTYALAFPEAEEWGDSIIKARGKIFVSLRWVEDTLRVGVKLPTSSEMALTLPFTEPGGRGLGRAGWVIARFTGRQKPDVELLRGWIKQSYRAVAPRKLVAELVRSALKTKA